MSVRGLGAALGLAAMLAATPAAGQEALTVRLEAPDAVRAVLEEHVRLLKRDTLALPEQQADRVAMTRRARREIADLLATEGYFSPRIRFNRDDPANWVLEVEPGLRTEIAAVDIAFTGELAVSGEGGQEYLELLRASWGLPVGQPFRQSAWDAAKAGLLDVVGARSYAAARIAESRANVAAARAQLDLAERTQQRNEELQAKNFISANSLDNSRGALASARENFRAREAQLTLTVQALPKATIRAPLKGVVSERSIEVGQHVGANARLFAVVDLTELEFAAKLPMSEIGAIQIGQAVTLTVEGVSEPVVGRIERISPVAEDASRMIPVFIRVANRSEALKGGMVARGEIVVAGREKALSISDQALRDDNGKPWALVRVGDRLERRMLELGIREERSGQVEVRAGLRAGEQVLLARVPMLDLSRKLVVR